MLFFPYFTDASHHLVTFSFFFYSYLFHLAVSFPCFFLSAATHTKYTFKNIFTLRLCHSLPPPSPRQRNSTPELSTLVFLFHVLLIYWLFSFLGFWFVVVIHHVIIFRLAEEKKKTWRWYLRHRFLIVWIGYQISKIKGMLFLI